MTEKFVYVISSEVAVKIGISGSPKNRMSELSTASPYMLNLEFVVEANWYSNHALDVERRVHAAFEACRMNGEWFKVSASEAVAEVKKQLHATRDDHFRQSDKHILVGCVRELDEEVKRYWPISLITWKVDHLPDGNLKPLSENVLARLTLQDAKDLVAVLQEDIAALERDSAQKETANS